MTSRHDTTIITASSPSELSPIEAALMDACNTLHEARELGDRGMMDSTTNHIWDLLDQYDASDGEDHPNPAWARPNQRALALSAMGRVDQAIQAELMALKYADTPRRLEISLGNLSDRCLRLGEPDRAVQFFLEAYEANPNSVPVLITGALALHAAGMVEQANLICQSLLDSPGVLSPGAELAAYLECDQRTRSVASEIPALGELFKRWESLKGQIGGRS
ncbi:MAG: tetratricopeptide repeat protein [Phycisphaerales bacterium]|nr:tetratricopeptide repeat protein [Phycisphaerales bacterium]